MAKLPAFSLPASDGKTWTNADLKGAPAVIYAYPKDATPGCTVEACDFRDHHAGFAKLGVTVLGLSPDGVKSHGKFITKQSLPFVLLSDETHGFLTALGIWVEKSMYGRTYMGVERSTFLIAADGTIVETWRKVSVKGHVDAVFAAAQAHVADAKKKK